MIRQLFDLKTTVDSIMTDRLSNGDLLKANGSARFPEMTSDKQLNDEIIPSSSRILSDGYQTFPFQRNICSISMQGMILT